MAPMRILCLWMISIDFLSGDMSSSITFQNEGSRFIPLNPRQLISTISSVGSKQNCAYLCHQNPSCRTFVFDISTCELYDGSISTGQVVSTPSASSIVGGIVYDDIDLSASYNQSCDRCYPDRYLVCQNGRCQCPASAFWNEKNQCVDEQFVGSISICAKDNWCRQDMNLTCVCKKCQCPVKTFWKNGLCINQFLQGASCNTSDQCRNDLQLVCSKTNKTCSALSPVLINVINVTIPDRFNNLGTGLFWGGGEWWRAFDNNTATLWNAVGAPPNIIYVTFNDEYLLISMQLTVYGDMWHDPKVIELYADENGTCLSANFTYAQAPSNYYTYPVNSFTTLVRPLIGKGLLVNIAQMWSVWQIYLPELKFYGIPY